MFNYIIVGAGFAGSVMAERISNILDEKVLLIEKRDHIGGNCYDFYDNDGILIHKYGPHIFHTNLKKVWDYLSNFTEWTHYEHKVLGYVDGKKVPIPFNLNTLRQILPDNADLIEDKLIKTYGYNSKIPILELSKTNDKYLKFLSKVVFQKIFLNYTKKQWGRDPNDLDPSVTNRVPIITSKDNRYFQDKYQGLPKKGYISIFHKLLSNSRIHILLNTDFKELIKLKDKKIYVSGKHFKGKFIFTGSIDELFNYKFGNLPYRSLKFKFKKYNQEYYQDVGTINYPNSHDFTRITEYKHLTGQSNPKTVINIEYPQKYCINQNIPYYPIPKKEYNLIYKEYEHEAQSIDNLYLLGRLAEYKYYNMDEVIHRALKVFEEISSE
ncbi:MAG: UDP-galactopyranose mutase [Methanobacterium sp.]|jgi:UDP-galactopyranose mutase|nr:UDP-galactopyranose mutase [Methanobacterium sp.]